MVEIPLIWILLRMHHEQIISKMSLNAKCSDQYSRFRVGNWCDLGDQPSPVQ